jgi:hypothetical protein
MRPQMAANGRQGCAKALFVHPALADFQTKCGAGEKFRRGPVFVRGGSVHGVSLLEEESEGAGPCIEDSQVLRLSISLRRETSVPMRVKDSQAPVAQATVTAASRISVTMSHTGRARMKAKSRLCRPLSHQR